MDHINIVEAIAMLNAGKAIQATIIAHAGQYEREDKPEIQRLERELGVEFYQRWTDGQYHYRLVPRGSAEDLREIDVSYEAAKSDAPHAMHSPCIARLTNGRYDSYPHGHPLPQGAVVVERLLEGKWRKVN